MKNIFRWVLRAHVVLWYYPIVWCSVVLPLPRQPLTPSRRPLTPSRLPLTPPAVHVADRELRSEINVTLRELHRFASYSQDHGNVDIRSFSIWSPMYTPCNLEIQPGQASETEKCDPRHEIWDRILLVTFWQNVVFLDPEGKVTQKKCFHVKEHVRSFSEHQKLLKSVYYSWS